LGLRSARAPASQTAPLVATPIPSILRAERGVWLSLIVCSTWRAPPATFLGGTARTNLLWSCRRMTWSSLVPGFIAQRWCASAFRGQQFSMASSADFQTEPFLLILRLLSSGNSRRILVTTARARFMMLARLLEGGHMSKSFRTTLQGQDVAP